MRMIKHKNKVYSKVPRLNKPVVTEVQRNEFYASIENDFLKNLNDHSANPKNNIDKIKSFIGNADSARQYMDSLSNVSDMRYWKLTDKTTSAYGFLVTSIPALQFHPDVKKLHQIFPNLPPDHFLNDQESHAVEIPNAITKEWEVGLSGSGGVLTEHTLRLAGTKGVVSTYTTVYSTPYNEHLGFRMNEESEHVLRPIENPDIWELKDSKDQKVAVDAIWSLGKQEADAINWQRVGIKGGYLRDATLYKTPAP